MAYIPLQAYSGKYVTSPPQRLRQCPSLQTSHFELGMNEQQHLTTHNNTEYPGRPIDHVRKSFLQVFF